ncbi:4Fe-4S dicluster domain-containing protein [bacterium]|nr:MAG: 4Fe-4S dicluster domain-containing protein [bacterium]
MNHLQIKLLMPKIKFKINNKEVETEQGKTILEAGKENNIYIPNLCNHTDLDIKPNCRVCSIEIRGQKKLVTACSTIAKEGMEVFTDTPRVKRARKINLELIFSQHKEECNDCVWNYNCQLLTLAKKNDVEITRFKDRKTNYPTYRFGGVVEFDSSKCIDCRNCVDMCQKQGIGYLEVQKRGHEMKIVPTKKKDIDCVYCGQCITHCPAGAFESKGEFEEIEKPLLQKNKIVVAQFAPSIRTSIGEEFGMDYGEVVTGKIVMALKKLGFDYVFDTSTGADFTTFEESQEVIERIHSGKNLPILTSCCPSWVKYIEFFHPEFIPNLSTARSPQAMLGGIIKTYWAKKKKINPQNIVVVSIMPCVAKKYEISRSKLKINGMPAVDYVLTTREFARLLIKQKIDFANLKTGKLDALIGKPSGAGVIYGASGGVMESAFRTTYEKLTGKKLDKIEFKEVRGMEDVKKAEINIKGKCHKIAVINGLGNVKKIIKEIKENPQQYTCIEVMACPGGCIGGGGQPLPTDENIRLARANGLYEIDKNTKIRRAHENPTVKKIYSEFFDKNKKARQEILHTSYHKQKRGKVEILSN